MGLFRKIFALSLLCAFCGAGPSHAADPAAPPTKFEVERILRLMEEFDNHLPEIQSVACRALRELEKPDCAAEAQALCKKVFSQEIGGTWRQGPKHWVNLGEKANSLSHGELRSYRATLAARKAKKFPAQLEADLNQRGYFAKVEEIVAAATGRKLSRAELAELNALRTDANKDEETCFQLGAMRAALAKHSHYSPGKRIPKAIENEILTDAGKAREEFDRLRWEDDPEWRKVKAKAEDVVKSAIEMVQQDSRIGSETRKVWLDILAKLRIVPPIKRGEIDCANGEDNAMYLRTENVITVCSGYFDVSHLELVIGHEIGHALGIGRAKLEVLAASAWGQDYKKIREASCAGAPLPCSAWRSHKEKLAANIREIRRKKFANQQLYKCLAEREGKYIIFSPDEEWQQFFHESHPLPESGLTDSQNYYLTPEGEISSASGFFAESYREFDDVNAWITLTKKEMPLANGTFYANPNYLNACGIFKESDEENLFDSESIFAEFYIQEYRCNTDSAGGDLEKMQMAKANATELATKLFAYLPGSSTTGWSHADSMEEHFSDVIGMDFYLWHMRRTRIDRDDPKLTYLTNILPFCGSQNGLNFPGEAEEAAKYGSDPHSVTPKRLRELFPRSVADYLGCRNQWSHENCEL